MESWNKVFIAKKVEKTQIHPNPKHWFAEGDFSRILKATF